MSTIRGRAGVTISTKILAYLTGGVAFAHFSDAWGFPSTGDFLTSNNTRVGWTGGGGLEYMLDPHWTVRIEGLYADFGSKDASIATFGSSYSSSFRHSVAIARGALNWKW